MFNFIEENDLTLVNLSVELERAVIGYELQKDESIYVTEDGWFPYWIRVLPKPHHLITLHTFTNFRKNTTLLERLELCNGFNRSQYMVAAYVKEDYIGFNHALTYKDGILRENMIRICRLFSEQIWRGINEFDPEFAIMLQPGQSEEENVQND